VPLKDPPVLASPPSAKPLSTTVDASSTYARYVPSKPKTKSPASKPDPPDESNEIQPRKKRRKIEVTVEEKTSTASSPVPVSVSPDNVGYTISQLV